MSDKKLGFGLMRLPLTNPEDEKSVDMPVLKSMVDTFMERGSHTLTQHTCTIILKAK